jgi:chemotaxis protein MotB
MPARDNMNPSDKVNVAPVSDGPYWHITFIDILLLIVIFMTLISASYRREAIKGMALPADINREMLKKLGKMIPIDGLYSKLLTIFSEDIRNGSVNVQMIGNEIKITFPAGGLFTTGSAEIVEEGRNNVLKICRELAAVNEKFTSIDVEGHTDPYPIATVQFPSNWELSAARAANVVRMLANNGVDETRLHVSAYADTHPRLPVVDSLGFPLIENYPHNRRIEIRIYFSGVL